jgi:POT family proton-dependent oligopeptide transporter
MIASFRDHPTGFWFIFWGELAERASFYGMKTLLLLYMVNKLGYSDADSSTIVSFFTAMCYILPIIGGYIADRWLGKFKTIIYFAIPYILGHIVLGTFETRVGLFMALALLAGGSGAIKPNISTLMGLMYSKAGKGHLLSQAFSWFYMAINIGAAMTTISLPFIRDHYGYGVAFMAPTILMVVSLGIFYIGKRYYPKEDMAAIQKEVISPEQKKVDFNTTLRILGLFFLIIFFWSIFDQSYSTWTLFARDYMILDTVIGRIPPDAIQGLNPVFIVLLTPVFAWLWSRTDKSETVRLSSPTKMLLGFVLVILCMGVMSVAGFFAARTEAIIWNMSTSIPSPFIVFKKVSILWELFAYVLITSAELCISVIGLQLAFEEAPKHMKSRITGFWLATVFFGDFLAGLFARYYTKTTPGNYFGAMTLMIIGVTIAFYFVGKKFERKSVSNNQVTG